MSNVEDVKSVLRVIIVEDREDDAELLLRELKRGGYDLHYRAVDDERGLRQALDAGPWDIVISDWALPTFDGMAAFRVVRQIDVDVPFIIVSGTIQEEHAVDALRAGVQDFMSKGRFARLVPAVRRELREAEVRRQRAVAELELARQREETARSERLLRSVLETVPDGVVVVDANGRVVVWSAGARDVFKMDRATVSLDEWPVHYGLFLPDRSTRVAGSDLAIARSLSGEAVDWQELYLRNAGVPEGAWLGVSGRPLRDGGGNINGAVAVFRDITKERAAQEQLMISDRLASVGMLAAGVAHEINNPLNAALLNLELTTDMLARPERSHDDELRESISDALSALARVRNTVGDLRVFSRHEESVPARADVHKALESSLRMAFNETRHRARVVKDYAARVPFASGSEGRLVQVFLNLIVNAAQAIPEGKVDENTIRVRTCTSDTGAVVVEVSDTGPGIRPEDIPHLFTPFFTTKPSGIGTGLGLPICQRIVGQVGGVIDVESERGRGTTVRVTLPAAVVLVVEPSPASVRLLVAPKMERRGRILVVDDEPMLGTAIRRVLTKEHDVVTTTGAGEALERLRTGQLFDVIFSDLMMPQVTGMELYAQICAEFPEHAPRVVFLTGGAFTQAARDFLAGVPNPTLEKPIDRAGLIALVSERVRSSAIPPHG